MEKQKENGMLIHKETFYQAAHKETPSQWVVQYWDNDPNDFPDAKYFNTMEDAKEFEKTLIEYGDWLSSQEIPLAVQ